MKFKDYLKEMTELAKKFPECLEYDTVYSFDEEGNNFSPVCYFGSFLMISEDGECTDEEDSIFYIVNSICVN